MDFTKTLLLLSLGLLLVACQSAPVAPAPSEEENVYKLYYEEWSERMAAAYRAGKYDGVWLYEMRVYFHDRLGKMTQQELIEMLGEPRIVPEGDEWYIDALQRSGVYPPDTEPADMKGKHDLVLLYNEDGPPHDIADETENFFFIVKDNVVVGLYVLS